MKDGKEKSKKVPRRLKVFVKYEGTEYFVIFHEFVFNTEGQDKIIEVMTEIELNSIQ